VSTSHCPPTGSGKNSTTTRRTLSSDNVARLYVAIRDFENAQDVREIAALAAGHGAPKRVAA